jgi:hypothetical protein
MKGKLIQRIGLLYDKLIHNACDVTEIEALYRENNIQLKRRQIYRDIILLEKLTASKGDRLKTIQINDKKRKWIVVAKEKKKKINSDIIYTHFFKKNNSVPLITKDRIWEYNNFVDNLLKNSASVEFQLPSLVDIKSDDIIFDSNFFIKKPNLELENKLRHLYWCISNHTKIKIIRTKLDSTCNQTIPAPLYFNPLKIIIHRGTFYIAGTTSNKRVLAFELGEIIEYEVLKTKYKNVKELVNHLAKEMNKRFGLSENINNKTYNIILEFSDVTGEFISAFHFHKSQKFYRHNENIRMELNCGINRELIGWIMMWMTNVRIISPIKLSELYHFTLERIKERTNLNSNFGYENLFMQR